MAEGESLATASHEEPLSFSFVPSGRTSQRRVKQVEGVFTFSQFLLFRQVSHMTRVENLLGCSCDCF